MPVIMVKHPINLFIENGSFKRKMDKIITIKYDKELKE
jgi:hypothetical protein